MGFIWKKNIYVFKQNGLIKNQNAVAPRFFTS